MEQNYVTVILYLQGSRVWPRYAVCNNGPHYVLRVRPIDRYYALGKKTAHNKTIESHR